MSEHTIVHMRDIGAGRRFSCIEACVSFHDIAGLRLVRFDADAITFAPSTTTAPPPPNPAQTPKAARVTKATPEPKRHYRQDVCAVCGGERDMGLKRALCRSCYCAQKREQYAAKKARKAA